MRRVRIIPTLLLDEGRLVKTLRFKKPIYVGEPFNTVKIFNDKRVDELILLDITASRQNNSPDVGLIREIASECFMPLSYGGGITSFVQAQSIFAAGIEKIILNTGLFTNPGLIKEIAEVYGSQAVVVAIDVKRSLLTRKPQAVYRGASKNSKVCPVVAAKLAVDAGAGEIMVTAIDREGTMMGYDIELIKSVASTVNVPVIASGGASTIGDFLRVVRDGEASAAAAGAMFVFNGPHRAILISYPDYQSILTGLFKQL